MNTSKILITATFLVFNVAIIKAQSTKPILPDTAKNYEVGINTTPAIVFAVGAEAAQNYVLNFRVQHNKTAFQIKGNYNQAMDVSNPPTNYTIQDSVVTAYDTYSDPEKHAGIAAGIEFYNPKRRIRLYWGFDLLLQYYINRKSQSTYSYASDSTLAYSLTYPALLLNEGTLQTYQWATGAGIKGGVRFPLSKHFSLQTETHINFVYIFKGTSKSTGDTNQLTKPTSGTLDLNTDALIPEITLFYRF